ncbi:MAG TPA: 4-hydroxy-tetrahydrodipicolinate synthase [Verrucomicrobia bacterium]|nr:MAG: 4-hydroxy-tetrahydrodipicolinate synthase [Lentisphaerae bacterium GWF2_57_35]HBA84021.1 4-hydroxy-tetrahydrodipicolinate synthase [Verrucomicrobiota bacterium]
MFEGAYTALVTPFTKSGTVDFEKLKELVELQIAGGIDGLVPVGTTGESPTLDVKEHEKVIETVIAAARQRVKIVAGTGANSTAEALELTRHAQQAGADGTLQVTPYYNKPNSTGLIRHFSAVADLGLPTVLYNVPGRAGKEIPIDVIVELAKHPKIVAVKEAGGSVDRVSQILTRCRIEVLSGDDGLTLPMMIIGAVGVISVASNIAPKPVAELVHHALKGQWKEARALHLKYYRLFTDLFLDTNPVPIKAAMAMKGLIEEVYRLPLCEMTDALKAKLRETVKAAELL